MNKNNVGARRNPPCGARQKYFLDEPGRRLILALYDSSTERLDELQQRLSVPRYIVKRWASQLGVTYGPGRKRWKPEDVEYLEKHFQRDRAEGIAKRLGYTVEAVRNKAYSLDLTQRHDEGYTLAAVCDGFGVTHGTAKRWIDQGWLKGERRLNHASNDPWTFTPENIRAFIRDHPLDFNLKRVDQLWFLDVCLDLGSLSRQRSR